MRFGVGVTSLEEASTNARRIGSRGSVRRGPGCLLPGATDVSAEFPGPGWDLQKSDRRGPTGRDWRGSDWSVGVSGLEVQGASRGDALTDSRVLHSRPCRFLFSPPRDPAGLGFPHTGPAGTQPSPQGILPKGCDAVLPKATQLTGDSVWRDSAVVFGASRASVAP